MNSFAKTRGRSNELSSSSTIETHQTSAIQLKGVFFDTIANTLWFFILPFASKPEADQTSFTNNGATHVCLRLISKVKMEMQAAAMMMSKSNSWAKKNDNSENYNFKPFLVTI